MHRSHTVFPLRPRRPDSGYSTESVVVIALLVGLAIAVFAVLTPAVTDKADEIVSMLSE
ncbi:MULTISPECIES: hypothetical protein [Nocardiopsis]|uniref:Uncharacterized protein n=2 Tax=Nocardiopsis TaxID=2013 RepID=A0ABT4TR63_9ACTN|nr:MULTISPECIES: hypothetical protein [Nocardiopsis]MDA2807166.1 hypothetical protein [Nocardiopsis suaedae]MDA2809918.1 hypothetical protein [Nocardiopsis endophytica]